MSLPGLVAVLVLAVIVVLWIALPLLRRENSDNMTVSSAISRQRERLTLYYSRVLRNIHDLDEDFATGKLDEAEYQQEREAWAQRGVAALAALDNIAQSNQPLTSQPDAASDPDDMYPESAPAVDDAALDASIEAAIEAAVQKQRTHMNQRTQP
jgi:uncharacterized membrane protein